MKQEYFFTDQMLENEIKDWRGNDFYTGTAGWIPGGNGTWLGSEGYPLRFGIKVPDIGLYQVEVEIPGGEEGLRGLTLCVGRRNIVERGICIPAGGVYRKTFYYGVYPYRPVVGRDDAVTDDIIGLSVIGKGARLGRVCVKSCDDVGQDIPTLFIGGDSTVRDYEGCYPYNPLTNGGSWGQNLLQYMDKMAVCNQAHSGLTTNCFREDGHWELVKANLRPGDVFLFGFGHNDQKRRNLKPYDQFAANIRQYVMEAREMGAVPVLVTPMSRIPSRDQDGWYDLLEAYADSIRGVGREMGAAVIDLHSLTFERFCAMGTEGCQNYFNDTTHVNDYGGALLADLMAREIRGRRMELFYGQMNNGAVARGVPDLALRPDHGAESSQAEERPNLSHDLAELPYVDCRTLPEKEAEVLKKAMAYGLLDPCVRYLHPHEEMPRAQFVFLLLKAVNPARRRPWQGEYCDLSRYEFDAEQIQMALDEGLIDPVTTPGKRFRPDDAITLGELVSFAVRGAKARGERELGMEECFREAGKWGWIGDEGEDGERRVTRGECIGMAVGVRERVSLYALQAVQ